MSKMTPLVRGDRLIYQQDEQEQVLAVETPAWFAWLATASTFAFTSDIGTSRLAKNSLAISVAAGTGKRTVRNTATILSGPIVDQTALHGVLIKIRDLSLPLLSLTRIDPDISDVFKCLLYTQQKEQQE
jgi:hypothetical protein